MKHHEAVEWLALHAAGELPDRVAPSFEKHVRGCSACQEWLASYSLLGDVADAVGSSVHDGAVEHPDAEDLALFLVRPEQIEERHRPALMSHLEGCPDCREDARLVGEAVAEARPGARTDGAIGSMPSSQPQDVPRVAWTRWLVAAACVGLLLPVTALIGRPKRSEDGQRTSEHRRAAEAGVEVVEDIEIDGTQQFAGEGLLLVSEVHVNSGATVSFRAGEGVGLGSGFRIGEGGSLVVAVGGP